MKELFTPRGLSWTQDRVTAFRRQHPIGADMRLPDPDLLTMNEAKAYLGVGHNGLLNLVKRGVISPNQISEFAPWHVSLSELDSAAFENPVKILKQTGRLPKGGCPKNQLTLFDDECST